MNDFVIVIPTYSKYLNVVNTFLQLLKKNWSSCPFKIVISITGENKKIEGYTCLYNGKKASLIDCVVNVAKKFKSRYYISFLGDAFISKKVDNELINDILNNLLNDKIDYCSILCLKYYAKEKKYNNYFRYINQLDRYSHSFVSFIASYEYIYKELIKFNSDFNFEEFYLSKKNNIYYNNHLIVRNNYFNILPSITKGKWDAINLRKLKKNNPEIDFVKLERQAYVYSSFLHFRSFVIHKCPSLIIIKLISLTKRFLANVLHQKVTIDE